MNASPYDFRPPALERLWGDCLYPEPKHMARFEHQSGHPGPGNEPKIVPCRAACLGDGLAMSAERVSHRQARTPVSARLVRDIEAPPG